MHRPCQRIRGKRKSLARSDLKCALEILDTYPHSGAGKSVSRKRNKESLADYGSFRRGELRERGVAGGPPSRATAARILRLNYRQEHGHAQGRMGYRFRFIVRAQLRAIAVSRRDRPGGAARLSAAGSKSGPGQSHLERSL